MADPAAVTEQGSGGALPVRRIGWSDIKAALAEGNADFRAVPTHLVLLVLIYPVVGLVLGRLSLGNDVLPLIFPLLSGFALVGPVVAVGLYVLSKRRDEGLPVNWRNSFDVLKSPALGTIIALGVVLLVILVAWLFVAFGLYRELFGTERIRSVESFVAGVLGTPAGFRLILLGNLIGFCFAVVTLAVSAISFPLALDRNVSFATAIATSVKAVLANPVTMALWGLVVVGLLLLGALPLFVGLAVVMPVLGHATWHLYKRIVP